jgi:DNA-binding MarR family transcriptional regulator
MDIIVNTLFTLMQSYRVTIREAINANELGLNAMHVQCLHLIANNKDCTANDIVVKTQRDKAQIARLVKELINLSLLIKKASETDKRRFELSFTAEGKVLYNKLLKAEQAINDKMCKHLTSQQINDFLSIAEQINNNIQH